MGINMNEAVASQYLKKEDVVVDGVNVTIDFVKEDEIGQEQERKYILYFVNNKLKPLVLNKTNIRILIAMYGANSDGWEGQQINCYNDLSVSFGGNQGGCRVRPATAPTPTNAAAHMVAEVFNGGQQEAFQQNPQGQQQAPPPTDADAPGEPF